MKCKLMGAKRKLNYHDFLFFSTIQPEHEQYEAPNLHLFAHLAASEIYFNNKIHSLVSIEMFIQPSIWHILDLIMRKGKLMSMMPIASQNCVMDFILNINHRDLDHENEFLDKISSESSPKR